MPPWPARRQPADRHASDAGRSGPSGGPQKDGAEESDMSKTTELRDRAMRQRPEIARLRAVGSLTQRVLVDGRSVLRWCARTGADPLEVLLRVREAADIGRRDLVLVVPALFSPGLWPAPHVQIASAVGVASLLRDLTFGSVDLPARPGVVVAGVEQDRQLLDVLEGGASGVLDIATGRLWSGNVRDRYDPSFAAAHAPTAAGPATALAAAIQAKPAVRPRAAPYVASAWHRQGDAVVLDEVLVDDGARRHAVGHADGLALLEQALCGPNPAVVLSSLDVLDALADAGRRLPPVVEDPAMACVVLDPDRRPPPAGLVGSWAHVLGCRADRGPRPASLERLLDELPYVRDELRQQLDKAGLPAVYEDVSRTVPILAALEREGFRVDVQGLAADIAHVQTEMNLARAAIVSGSPRVQELRNADLVHAPKEEIALLIQWSDGALPPGWRTDPPMLERYAAFGNPRAQAVMRLRALDAVHAWMKRIEGVERLRSIVEPAATGRWYPHGEALSTIPRHIPEAMRLRQHLVPGPGQVLVAGDYSAFEPRLLAHQSGDPVLVAGCQPGHDVYTDLMPLLQVPTRELAKAALLALLYGNSAESFAASLPLPLPVGHRIFHALEKALPVAIAFRKQVQKGDTLTAKSLYGWRRVRGDDTPSEWARRAFNLRTQGTAADLLWDPLESTCRHASLSIL